MGEKSALPPPQRLARLSRRFFPSSCLLLSSPLAHVYSLNITLALSKPVRQPRGLAAGYVGSRIHSRRQAHSYVIYEATARVVERNSLFRFLATKLLYTIDARSHGRASLAHISFPWIISRAHCRACEVCDSPAWFWTASGWTRWR